MNRVVAAVAVLASSILLAACNSQAQAPSPSPTQPSLSIETIAVDLDTPWAMDFAPDGRIFITERPGTIRTVSQEGLAPEPWLTLEATETGEGGLLGIALDADFAENGLVYAAYTYRTPAGVLQNRLVRLKEDRATGKGTLDRILLDEVPGAGNHDGGRVKVGPDSKLYWTTGDASNAQRAQELSSLAGKILRLNTDGTVPADNPFPGSPVYSYGHRNPEGLAWEPDTARLYATEHGPSAQDEINFIEPGKNYGWPVISGDARREGMVSPVLQSGSETWAPAGAAFISQGAWAGSLLFTGLRGQSLYRVTFDESDPTRVASFERFLTGEYGRLRDVAQAPDGSIYILTNNRDGRGNPSSDDDKLLKIILE